MNLFGVLLFTPVSLVAFANPQLEIDSVRMRVVPIQERTQKNGKFFPIATKMKVFVEGCFFATRAEHEVMALVAPC